MYLPKNKLNKGCEGPIYWKLQSIIKRDWKRHKEMERYSMLMDWKNQILSFRVSLPVMHRLPPEQAQEGSDTYESKIYSIKCYNNRNSTQKTNFCHLSSLFSLSCIQNNNNNNNNNRTFSSFFIFSWCSNSIQMDILL